MKKILFCLIVVILTAPNAGAQLEEKLSTEQASFQSMFFLDEQYGWAGGYPIYRTTDGGEHWETMYSGDENDENLLFWDITFLTRDIGFALNPILESEHFHASQYDGIVYRTDDSGKTWEKIDSLPPGITSYVFYDENTGWACQRIDRRNAVVLKTTDGGETWEQIWEPEVPWNDVQLFDILPVSPDSFWIIQGENDAMYYSHQVNITLVEDDGNSSAIKSSWSNLGNIHYGKFADASSPELLIIRHPWEIDYEPAVGEYVVFEPATEETMFYDSAPLWDVETTDNETYYFHFHNHPDYDNRDCIMYSNDNGATLELLSVLPELKRNIYEDVYKTFSMVGKHSFCITSLNKIYKYHDETVDVSQKTPSTSQVVVYPPSPNPFNPSTTISFGLAAAQKATLTVYDITGRTVATLADGFMQAGTHSVVFDGTGLASGLYFYRVEAGGMVRTGKMVLVR